MAQEVTNIGCTRADATPPVMAAGNIGIRPVAPNDGPALHELLTASIPDVLPDRDRWLARWQWQYWRNPFRGNRPAGWVFADGGRILGHLGAVYLPMRLGDRCIDGVIGADYAVADEFLAAGGMFAALELAQKLFTECDDRVVMATTANEKTGAVFGRYGARPVDWTREFWRAPTTLGQQIRSCRGGENRVARRLMSGIAGRWFSRVMTTCYEMTRHLPAIPIPQGCSLEIMCVTGLKPVPHIVPVTDDILSEPLCVDRTQDYLDWRYNQHPESEHVRVLTVSDISGSPLGAAIVFHEQRHDRNVMYIEDMMVVPRRTDIARTLLCAALRLACRHEADYVVTSPGQRAIRDVFWELGFEDRARNAPAVAVHVPISAKFSESKTAFTSPKDQLEFWHGMMF